MVKTSEHNGIIMSLGAIPKPRDPNEDRYMLSRTLRPVKAVNLNEPVSLGKFRPPILYQMSVGACAMFSSVGAAFTSRDFVRASKGQTLDAELAHPGYLYERARKLRGWWPEDSGSIVSDGLDILKVDTPLMSKHRYVDNASFDYPDEVFEDNKIIDQVASHRAFFVEEGNALEQLHAAFTVGMAVVISMYWPDKFFAPVNGKLPENIVWSPSGGAHAIYAWGMTPDKGGIVGASNSWSDGWNRTVTQLGFDFRPGDFAIPFSFFQAGKNSPIFEMRAVSPEPVIIPEPPKPEPKPEPEPSRGYSFEGTGKLSSANNLVIQPTSKDAATISKLRQFHRKPVKANVESR